MIETTLRGRIFKKYYAKSLNGSVLNNFPENYGYWMNGVVTSNAYRTNRHTLVFINKGKFICIVNSLNETTSIITMIWSVQKRFKWILMMELKSTRFGYYRCLRYVLFLKDWCLFLFLSRTIFIEINTVLFKFKSIHEKYTFFKVNQTYYNCLVTGYYSCKLFEI